MPRHLHFLHLPLVLAMALVFAAGCSNDPTKPSPTDDPATTGTLQAQFSATDGNFEIDTNPSGDPANPMPGPFRIHGSNVHYDSDLGALVVDLTVENRSRRTYSLPVLLTFLGLFPDGVQVLNPDNGEHGPGAQIEFQFDQSDLLWSPGEMSLPRTVQFAVAAGTAIGFVARIDVGLDPDLGSIGGVVFDDQNQNGMMDTDEPGIAGAMLTLSGPDNLQMRTRSLRDGSYRFENLQAGTYTVSKMAMDGTMPTTPTELVVVLPQTDGGVADFLSANFGCTRVFPPHQPRIERGDIVEVTGTYASDPDRIMAAKVTVHRPRLHEFPFVDAQLAGPVTDLARDRRDVAIAGTWLHVAETDPAVSISRDDCSFETTEVGDRVVAKSIRPIRVDTNEMPSLLAGRIDCWEQDADFVRGVVDLTQIARDPNGVVFFRLRVLNTWVIVTANTEIDFGVPPVEPYPQLTDPNAVVRSLVRSYDERNLDQFERVLGEGYTFHFADADVAAGAPATWERAREMAATLRMFSGEPGHTSDGQMLPAVQSIAVQLTPVGPDWTEGTGDLAGTFSRQFMAQVAVGLADGTSLVASGVQEFDVTGVARGDLKLYALSSWRDLGPAPVNAAGDDVSWGQLKLMFGQ